MASPRLVRTCPACASTLAMPASALASVRAATPTRLPIGWEVRGVAWARTPGKASTSQRPGISGNAKILFSSASKMASWLAAMVSLLTKGTRCIVESYSLHATSHCARGVPELGNKDDIVREPYDDRGDGPASQNRHGGCCVPHNTYCVLYPEIGRSAKKGSRVVIRISMTRE